MTIPMTADALESPGMQHARKLFEIALQHESQVNRLYEDLKAAVAPSIFDPMRFASDVHSFASVVLRSPRAFPAHVVDFATGLLSEAIAFVQADKGTRWGS